MANLSQRQPLHPHPWDMPTGKQQPQQLLSEYLIKGENNMSKLRTLNLTLVDNDTNLKGKQKIVFQQLGYVSEHTNDQTIQQILMSGDVATALEKHNKVRAEVVDDAILRNTGRDVFLKPVEIWDLEWQVVQAA